MKQTKQPAWYKKLISYKYYLPLADQLTPFALWIGFILAVIGIAWGLAFSPEDYQQGNSYRIIYIHVPAAMFSIMLYLFMGFLSILFLIFKIKLFSVIARSAAHTGAILTLIALVTGAIWGRPTWGTWWVWDLRLTSELILLFFYMGYIILDNAIEDRQSADLFIAILAILGISVALLVKLSVYFVSSIHQKSTLFAEGGPSMPVEMLIPLLIMMAAYLFFIAGTILKKSTILIRQELIFKKLSLL